MLFIKCLDRSYFHFWKRDFSPKQEKNKRENFGYKSSQFGFTHHPLPHLSLSLSSFLLNRSHLSPNWSFAPRYEQSSTMADSLRFLFISVFFDFLCNFYNSFCIFQLLFHGSASWISHYRFQLVVFCRFWWQLSWMQDLTVFFTVRHCLVPEKTEGKGRKLKFWIFVVLLIEKLILFSVKDCEGSDIYSEWEEKKKKTELGLVFLFFLFIFVLRKVFGQPSNWIRFLGLSLFLLFLGNQTGQFWKFSCFGSSKCMTNLLYLKASSRF